MVTSISTAGTRLGDDALQRGRQQVPHFLVVVRGEKRDNPVYRLRGVHGVKRTEDQVARIGRFEGDFHRFDVPDLSDHYHVGVLT